MDFYLTCEQRWYLYLLEQMKQEGYGIKQLSELTDKSQQQIRTAAAKLRELGLIEPCRENGGMNYYLTEAGKEFADVWKEGRKRLRDWFIQLGIRYETAASQADMLYESADMKFLTVLDKCITDEYPFLNLQETRQADGMLSILEYEQVMEALVDGEDMEVYFEFYSDKKKNNYGGVESCANGYLKKPGFLTNGRFRILRIMVDILRVKRWVYRDGSGCHEIRISNGAVVIPLLAFKYVFYNDVIQQYRGQLEVSVIYFDNDGLERCEDGVLEVCLF